MLMNKILRYSFMALLAMVFGNLMASESVDFTAQGYANAAEVAGYEGTDFTITLQVMVLVTILSGITRVQPSVCMPRTR